MAKKHDHKKNKRTISFVIGEAVSVAIPPIDRVGTDFQRLPCLVSDIKSKSEFYQLTSKFGILDVCYRTSDLEPYMGSFDFDYSKITNKISLRAAAQAFNKRCKDKSDSMPTCNCNGRCTDKRCSCFSKNEKCSSHCHSKSVTNICCNKTKN